MLPILALYSSEISPRGSDMTQDITVTGQVTAVILRADGSVRQKLEGNNLVTTMGLRHYAERFEESFNGTAVTSTFTTFVVGTGSTAADIGDDMADMTQFTGTTGEQVLASGYPKIDDDDTDNSGRGAFVLTWHASYGTGTTLSAIRQVGISVASPTGTNPLLMHHVFGAAFTKTTDETLKIFVNHTLA